MTTMTTDNGWPPYPKVTGMQTASRRQVVTTPTEQDKMKCAVCGLPEDGNPVHTDDYEGPGKHSFKVSSAKSYADDLLVVSGGELKSIGAPDSGEFDGLMIKFDTIDLTRDRFSKSTELFREVGDSIPILYDHGLDATIKRRQLGKATITKVDDAGVWVKGQLKLRDDYEKAIYSDMVVPGKAGLSSGAASHMVERKKSTTKGVQDIVSWGIAEVSITPRPTEPGAIIEVKSLSDYFDDDWDDSHDFLKSVWSLKAGGALGKMKEEGDYYHYRLRSPGDFDEESFRTITISNKPKVQAVVGKLKGESSTTLQNYMFATDVWDEDDAQKWVDEHKTDKKAIPGSTLGMPNKPHKFMAEGDDPNSCAICGKAEDDTLHDTAKAVATRPMKSLYEEKLAERVPSIWEYRSALDDVIADIAAAKMTEHISGVTIDTKEKITEAVTEYAVRVIPMMVTQVEDWAEERASGNNSSKITGSPYGENRFYLRSLPNDFNSSLQQFVALKSQPVSGETLEQNSIRAVSAVEELAQLATGAIDGLKSWAARVLNKIEFRHNDPTKSGRTISAATHSRLQAAHQSVGSAVTALSDVHSHIGDLIELAQRKPGDKVKDETDDDADAKSLSYEQVQLMLTETASRTELALLGETL